MNQSVRVKLIISLLALVFVITSAFGLSAIMIDMESSAGMITIGCPYAAAGHSLCPMNIMEHLASWSQLFVATLVVILFLSAVVVVFSFLGRERVIGRHDFNVWRRARFRNFSRQFFDDLALALSKGIVHSKIYPIVE